MQEIYPEVQHEAAHQDPQAGPGGDAEEQHQHRPDPQTRVSQPTKAVSAFLHGGEWTQYDSLNLVKTDELTGCVKQVKKLSRAG